MLTNSGLVEYCRKLLNMNIKYMWAAIGVPIDDELIDFKVNQCNTKYVKRYSDKRIAFLRGLAGKGYYGLDCVNLIKSFLWGGIPNVKYNNEQDWTATGMYNAASVKGPINSLPEKPGLAVYHPGHIGVYEGVIDGERMVIECTLSSRGDGVVRSRLRDVKWKYWLQVPGIVDDTNIKPIADKAKILIDNAKKIIPHPPMFDDIPKAPRTAADLARLNKTKDRL